MTNSISKEKHFLSITMPVYNEEEVIEKVVRDFCKDVLDKFEQKEFVVVNDGSTDRTLETLNRLKSEIDYLRIIDNKANQGHGRSLRTAYGTARGDLIFHCDSDNQLVAEDFWLLYNKLKEQNLEVVLGVRRRRHDPLHRLLITRTLRLFCFLLFGVKLEDSNSPFKLHARRALDKLLSVVPLDSFAPSLMMAVASKKLGMRVGEIEIRHLPRLTGKVSMVKWGLVKICFKCARELFKFRDILKKKEERK